MTDGRGQLMPYIYVQFEPNSKGWIRSYNCIVWDLDKGEKMPYIRSLNLDIEPGKFTAVVSYFADEYGSPCEAMASPHPYRILMTECLVGGVGITPPDIEDLHPDPTEEGS